MSKGQLEITIFEAKNLKKLNPEFKGNHLLLMCWPWEFNNLFFSVNYRNWHLCQDLSAGGHTPASKEKDSHCAQLLRARVQLQDTLPRMQCVGSSNTSNCEPNLICKHPNNVVHFFLSNLPQRLWWIPNRSRTKINALASRLCNWTTWTWPNRQSAGINYTRHMRSTATLTRSLDKPKPILINIYILFILK